MVGRTKGFGIAKVNFVLTGSLLVVGAFGLYAHLFEGQANFSSDVFALVLGGNVHISRLVVGLLCGLALLVSFEKIKFHFRAEEKFDSLLGGGLYGIFEDFSSVGVKVATVGKGNVAKHTNHPPVLRPPGKDGNGVGIGMKQQIGMNLAPEAVDRRSVDGNAVFKGSFDLVRHYGNIFLLAENIAKGETYKFYVLLLDILHYFIGCVAHFSACRFS